MPDSLSGQRVDFARGRRLIELANCYRELGKGIQAAQTYDAADAHFRKLGPEPASVVFAINGNRAKLQMRERHYDQALRSEEHTSELQSLMRISYAVFCLKKKKNNHISQ